MGRNLDAEMEGHRGRLKEKIGLRELNAVMSDLENPGRKDDTGKSRWDLMSPVFLDGIAHVLMFGANKYADRNWERGIAYGRVFAALMRHLWKWWGGASTDEETGYSHLWHAGCCLMFLAHFEASENYAEFDDRP